LRELRFVMGADRGQSRLLPECVDDFIGESNPVRVVDAFVGLGVSYVKFHSPLLQQRRYRPLFHGGYGQALGLVRRSTVVQHGAVQC
jgi:hypothetical protein